MVINGNLTFGTLGAGQVENAIIERLTTAQRASATHSAGRIVYDTNLSTYYFSDGNTWQSFSTGGNAIALAAELHILETSLGSFINNGVGTFNSAPFQTFNTVTNPTSLLNVLSQMDQNVSTSSSLASLTDVSVNSLVVGDVLQYVGGIGPYYWNNVAIGINSGIQPYHDSLVSIAGLTTSANQLIYTTSSNTYATSTLSPFIRTLLDDATAMNARSTLGLVIGTDVQGWNQDLEIISGFNHIPGHIIYDTGSVWAVGAPGATSGVQAWDADLDTYSSFSPSAQSTETITIKGVNIIRTGISDFQFSTNTLTEGNRWQIGRGAAARTALGMGDIAIMDEANFIRADNNSSNVSQDISWNNYKITSLANGSLPSDAVNYGQLQSAVAGLTWKNSVRVATTTNLPTLGGLLNIDSVSVSNGDRVLVKNQTAASTNGIYIASPSVWIRASDFESSSHVNGAATYVEEGSSQADTGWTVISKVTNFGTDPITWTQFNGASGVTAGAGLSKVGNTISVNLGAGIVELPNNEVGIDLYDPTGSAIILTDNGSIRANDTNAKLHLLLDVTGNGHLIQSANGLKVATNTITENELTNVADSTGAILLGNGIKAAVQVDNSSIEISSNSLRVKTLGVTNAMLAGSIANSKLAHSSITMMCDGLGIDTISLGDSFKISGGNGLVTSISGTTLTIAFVGNLNSLSDLSINSPAGAQTLVYSSSSNKFVNRTIYHQSVISTADNTWIINHGLGQKYCVVTIVDDTDNVIIPQSIVFNTDNQLTVTFNMPVAGVAVVMGISSA